MFWEGLERFLICSNLFLKGDISKYFVEAVLARYALAIMKVCCPLENSIMFIYGTVIVIAWTRDQGEQDVVKKRQEEKDAMKD